MLKRLGLRPVGWLAGGGFLVATAATMVMAAPSGAAAPEKQYPSSFTLSCVIAPGSLNIKGTFAGEMRFTGPESVTEGQSGIEFTDASITITAPAEQSNALRTTEARKARGQLTNLTIDASGLEPVELKLPSLAYEAPVEENKALVLVFPHEGTFSFGPYKVTGKSGEDARLSLSSKPGFKEVSPNNFEATGAGIAFTLEGLNEGGTSVIGPLTVACNPPNVTLASIPIGEKELCNGDGPIIKSVEPDEGPTSGGTTVHITYAGPANVNGNATVEAVRFGSHNAPSFSGGEGSVTAVSPPGEGEVAVELVLRCRPAETPGHFTYRKIEKAEYKSWHPSGTITDKKLGQAIELPAESVFNGSGEVNTETGQGSVNGSFTILPFSAPLKLFGLLPVSLGVTLTQAGSLEGTVTKSESVPGDETLTLPLKLNMGIASVSLLGLKIPTSCATAEPIALALTDTLTREELLKTGWSFAGTATLPKFKCEGGLLGSLFGVVLSGLLSGPENAYTLKVSA
jgi:IPT/TIG domain